MALIALGTLLALAALAPSGPPAPAPAGATPSPSPTSSRKIDEYGNISFAAEKVRLDHFAVELLKWPEAKGYILGYGGRRARAGEAWRRIERAKRYLLTTRGTPAARLVIIDGGHREDLTVELYIIPPNTTPPMLVPTVDPAEVFIIREGPRGKRPPHRRRRRS